jgi:hypothetical protein
MVPLDETSDWTERQRTLASWALSRWADFPIDSDPRPWVFVVSVVLPVGGFRTGEAKMSFLKGDAITTVPVREDVLKLVRDQGLQVSGPTVASPLVISGVMKSEADFSTDRGRVRLPAWGLTGPDINDHIWVLDPEVDAQRWRPTEPGPPAPSLARSPHWSFFSWIETDDRTLHYEFTGGAPEHVEYPDALVVESDKAVVVIPISHDIGPPGARRAKGYRREVVVHLAAKLGARVLVNLDASPVPVVER